MLTQCDFNFQWLIADAILGEDIITPSEIATARSLTYTQEQLSRLMEFIPPESVLHWCKENNYVVMAYPPKPTSFVEALEWEPYQFDPSPELECLWTDRTSFGWFAAHKGILPDSLRKNWREQMTLIRHGVSVPKPEELGWFLTTYYETRGVSLLAEAATTLRAYTSSVYVSPTRGDEPILLGPFDPAHCCNRKFFCDVGFGMPKIGYANVGSIPILRFPAI